MFVGPWSSFTNISYQEIIHKASVQLRSGLELVYYWSSFHILTYCASFTLSGMFLRSVSIFRFSIFFYFYAVVLQFNSVFFVRSFWAGFNTHLFYFIFYDRFLTFSIFYSIFNSPCLVSFYFVEFAQIMLILFANSISFFCTFIFYWVIPGKIGSIGFVQFIRSLSFRCYTLPIPFRYVIYSILVYVPFLVSCNGFFWIVWLYCFLFNFGQTFTFPLCL